MNPFVMHDLLITTILTLLTLLSLLASALAINRLRRSDPTPRLDQVIRWILSGCGAVGGGLFLYRAIYVHREWVPLEAHLDGLLLIATLLSATVLFLELRSNLSGVAAFALPLLTLLLAWSICASWFTLELFHVNTIWKTVHLASNYLGTLFFVIAAGAGGMFLYAHMRLRNKNPVDAQVPLASLEAIERLIVRTATLGFALLSLGVMMGVVDATVGPPHSGWFWSIKIVLASAVWLIFGIVMNVRYATSFRGARAAWLSITGMVLILATIAVSVSSLHQNPHGRAADVPHSHQSVEVP